MTVPTSPPAGWYLDPGGSKEQRYWDGEHWTSRRRSQEPPAGSRSASTGIRRSWGSLPTALKVALPIAVVLALVSVGFAVLSGSSQDNWAGLPKRLSCQTQTGPRPPENLTVSSVQSSNPRSNVLELVVRFAQPLPPPPTGSFTTGLVGYIRTFSVASDGKKFAILSPEPDSSELAISRAHADNAGAERMRPDRDTEAHRTTPDTVQILLDLKRFGLDNQPVLPEIALDSQFNTPSTTTVHFATQLCR